MLKLLMNDAKTHDQWSLEIEGELVDTARPPARGRASAKLEAAAPETAPNEDDALCSRGPLPEACYDLG